MNTTTRLTVTLLVATAALLTGCSTAPTVTVHPGGAPVAPAAVADPNTQPLPATLPEVTPSVSAPSPTAGTETPGDGAATRDIVLQPASTPVPTVVAAPTVTELTATVGGGLLWPTVPDATSYQVSLLDEDGVEEDIANTGAGTSWTPDDIPTGLYVARVYAVTASLERRALGQVNVLVERQDPGTAPSQGGVLQFPSMGTLSFSHPTGLKPLAIDDGKWGWLNAKLPDGGYSGMFTSTRGESLPFEVHMRTHAFQPLAFINGLADGSRMSFTPVDDTNFYQVIHRGRVLAPVHSGTEFDLSTLPDGCWDIQLRATRPQGPTYLTPQGVMVVQVTNGTVSPVRSCPA